MQVDWRTSSGIIGGLLQLLFAGSYVAARIFFWRFTHFTIPATFAGMLRRRLRFSLVATLLAVWMTAASAAFAGTSSAAAIRAKIVDFLFDRSLARAGRPVMVSASVVNLAQTDSELEVVFEPPPGARGVVSNLTSSTRFAPGEERDFRWQIQTDRAAFGSARLTVRAGPETVAEATAPLRFLPPIKAPGSSYIPAPQPVQTPILIGAHHCPLWEADKPEMWTQIRKHPERVPALGFYAQDNPEVSDWETTWAVEHGVSFFIYCWYRTSQGGPVQTRFSSAIHEGLYRSRYADKLRFTIMWENQSRGKAGVADERDLMQNLLPFWITNYFRHSSYLKVDNKPVLFIYRPEFLIQDLGGAPQVARAFDKMRQACQDAGFGGLHILGEYRGVDAKHLKLMQGLGLDYTFAYCWPVNNNPTPAQAIAAQMGYLRKTQEMGILPQVVTVSQGWTGWRDEGSIWRIPPQDFETLLRQAREFIAQAPSTQLGGRLLLLDNWNEWGEGHYIAPYTEHGFGYLDAVRKVFGEGAGPHTDLIPEDVKLGPYDSAYRIGLVRARELRRQFSVQMTKRGAATDGLVGWWAFDEDGIEAPVTFDYSGHRLGGELRNARRTGGWDGQALDCRGGCVLVPPHVSLSVTNALTIECWVKTDLTGQNNKWFVNRVSGGGADTGYRLGLLQGKPCFEVPQTAWSHNLAADVVLPIGRWVHLAGTFDGRVMRIYVDGELRGSMDRPGPIKPNGFPLWLGSYDVNHPAHFTGLLDEVRLYNRPLSAGEVATHARRSR